MHRIDPFFAEGDRRAGFFAAVVHLAEKGPTRDELVDAAVWGSDIYGVDLVARLATLRIDAALEALVIAAHDGFPCECCGYHTLEQPATRWSRQLCSACGWEDSDPASFGYDEGNEVDLDAAQQRYLEIGACEELWRELVTPPLPGQIRENGFEAIEPRRVRLLGEIESLFGEGSNPGMTLEDARAADDYDAPRPELDFERTQRWKDVDGERLEAVQEWVFLDADGAFFYLPAVIRFTLGNCRAPGDRDPVGGFLDYLKPLGTWIIERASRRELVFLDQVFTLLRDPWLEQSERWGYESLAVRDRGERALELIATEARR